MRRSALLGYACSLLLLSCGDGERGKDEMGGINLFDDPPQADPGVYLEGIEDEFEAAAQEFRVPLQALQAVAFVESQWMMIEGQVEFDGQEAASGVMALRGRSLEAAAGLLGVSVDQVKSERATNIRAGAALLRDLADERDFDEADLGAWAPVLADLSGIQTPEAAYAYIHNDVYGLIRGGLVVVDLGGNPVAEIEASPEVEPDFDLPVPPTLATQPDQPGAVWRTSSNFSARPAGAGGKVQLVIVHTCEGAYAGCWGWLADAQSGVSAHYVVKEDGSEVTQLVKEKDKAWHIAAKYDCGLNGDTMCERDGASSNNFTVGIEHAGFAKQGGWSANLIDQSAKLVCGIAERHAIPRDKFHVVGHGQLQPYNRIDPGPNWPWATYLKKISEGCAAPPPPDPDPQPNPDPQPMPGPDPVQIIVDSHNVNNNPALAKAMVSASWVSAASTPGYYGNGYYFSSTGDYADGAEFSFFLNKAGTRTVEVWYTAGANRSNAAPVAAYDAGNKKLGATSVNMQQGGKAWVAAGAYNFSAGWNKVVLERQAAAGKVIIADAVRLTAGGDPQPNPPPDPPPDPPPQDQGLDPNAPPVVGGSWWKPTVDATWQIQLAGALKTGFAVDMYDVDLFDTSAATITSLKSQGFKVICYFSGGSSEDWRPDFNKFDAASLGQPLDGWPGEKWLDIRSDNVLEVMRGRLDLAVSKGCDGVDPDNMDGFANASGFPLTQTDQIAYDRWMANAAHLRDLTVGLKNTGDLAGQLVAYFDFELNEQCWEYQECDQLAPFTDAGKPIFNIEYPGSLTQANSAKADLCSQAHGANTRTLLLPLELDGSWRVACD